MPIGNLTSQVFADYYLTPSDRFVKETLKMAYYGRYVDDFYIVDTDRKRLTEAVPQIASMLASIGLSLHPNKTRILPVTQSINLF